MILITGGAGFIGGNFVLDWLAFLPEEERIFFLNHPQFERYLPMVKIMMSAVTKP